MIHCTRPVNHIRIITISKLNAEWSNKYHLQHNESCNKAYFSIDDENPPYKGVKGKGIATLVEIQIKEFHKER